MKAAVAVSTHQQLVVGGGAAGSTVAGRFSMENVKTLLLDAGPDITTYPLKWHRMAPAAPWVHRAAGRYIEKHAGTAGGKEATFETPRVVGGAGVVLAPKSWVRGHEYDWKDGAFPLPFADSGLILYYKKLESVPDAETHRGNTGKFLLTQGRYVTKMHLPFLNALQAHRIGLLHDFNPPDGFRGVGAGRPEAMVDFVTGTTLSSINQILHEAVHLKRPVTIQGNTKVHSLILEGGKVLGVRTGPTGETEIRAPSTILAAGAVGTSAILRNTEGLPPEVEMVVKSDTALWAVPTTTLRFRATAPISLAPASNPLVQLATAIDWFRNKKGWMSGSYDDMVVFWESSVSRTRRKLKLDSTENVYPDFRIAMQPFMTDEAGGLIAEHGMQLQIQLMRPQARGHVDGSGKVTMAANAEDDAAMAEVVELMRQVCRGMTATLAKDGELEPLRSYVGPYGGTCPLGSVVDPDTHRVKGVEGLGVVDGSLVPNPLLADALPLTYALAERSTDKLLRRAPPIAPF